ncbi:MAG TPA: energy transducer TonB [Chitinophagaceae bacterium]|nr:energy transducer TonB [Chitinophagaceae bacterium]
MTGYSRNKKMAGKDNHKRFTAAEIRRYLDGLMSADEMFALESAALEDPFLADAIEGFDQSGRQINSNQPEDISQLHDRLQKRINRNDQRRLPLFLRKNIAAILILLAGAGTMVYYLVDNYGAERIYISQNESASTTLKDSVSPPPAQDPAARESNDNAKAATTDAETLQESRVEKPPQAPSPALARQSTPEPVSSQSAPPETRSKKFEEDIGYSSANKPGSGAASAASKNRDISGQVARHDTINLDGKGINDNIKAGAELSSTAPRSEFKSRDSIPSGVMETAATTTSRIEKQAPRVNSSAPAPPAAMPVIGWKAFEMYIQKNKKLPASLKDIHGKVVLSFTIGQNGKPQNFQVVQSLNKTMDEEAIRLLKEGPVWTAAENSLSPVNTTVNF